MPAAAAAPDPTPNPRRASPPADPPTNLAAAAPSDAPNDSPVEAPRDGAARYREQEIREYRGNPFIEALPPIVSREEVAERLGQFPEYRPEDRALPTHLRLHALWQTQGLMQPLTEHLDLAARLARMIRDGYVRRNPTQPGFLRRGLGIGAAVRGGAAGAASAAPPAASGRGQVRASSMTLLGISGVGKTTALERVLSLYPQVIVHREYAGRPLVRTQLVWLTLECPFDGSIRGLCVNFFEQVDAVLGTRYAALLVGARDTAETLLPKMARVAWEHAIGLLTVDEIQHLSEAKSGGEKRMLNFFVTLVNTIGVPVLLVGTYKAAGILAGEFRQARRGCGQGDFVWDAMEAAGERATDWRLFVETLAEYQYTRHDTPVTDDLVTTLYNETQGITALVVLLWVLAQERAIENGQEVVTTDVVESVAKDRFRLLRPLLQALRTKDHDRLRELGDVLPVLPRPRVLPGPASQAPAAGPPRPAAAPVGRPVADAPDDSHAAPAPGAAPGAAPVDALGDAGGGATGDAGTSPSPKASTAKRARARARQFTTSAPAGSLPRLVADALLHDRCPHDALRAAGLLCAVVAGVSVGGRRHPGSEAEARAA